MTPSEECYALIKSFEGLRLHAYLDIASVPTIGFGSTRYPSGILVKMGDVISEEEANSIFKHFVDIFSRGVDNLVYAMINQNHFDALISFSYNVGLGALSASTLLKKVNNDPADPTIRDEFAKWNKAGKKVVKALVKRRAMEADLYFTSVD